MENKVSKKIGVARFPGTNCDRDIYLFAKELGHEPFYLWHQDSFVCADYEMIIIPGGFSYGDYLRTGAMAAKSKIMQSVRQFAEAGRPVLGICNGFQILCEAGLLPGALVKNQTTSTSLSPTTNVSSNFIDKWVQLEKVNSCKYFASTIGSSSQKRIRLPIAHGEGRFYAPTEDIKKIEDQGLVWWRYVKNPNGSINDIAGVKNQQGNVAGLMPHPERAIFDWMGSTDGRGFLC